MMDRITTYTVRATLSTLRAARDGDIPSELSEPIQSVVQRMHRAATERPTSIYICSADDATEMRDAMAVVLMRILSRHTTSALLVDADFLNVGLGGLVPQSDALGFLDFLLYGSSLGVIVQRADAGIQVIGAGSFPVTRRMPFVSEAFDEALRRLLAHSRCVVLVGPLHDEGGTVHPLVGRVDVPVLVRDGSLARPGLIDPIEEELAERNDAGVLSIRVAPEEKRDVALKPREQREQRPEGAMPTSDLETTRVDSVPRGVVSSTPDPRPEIVARTSSLAPRIITLVAALLLLGFVGWWYWQERVRGLESAANSTPPGIAPIEAVVAVPPPIDTMRSVLPDTVAAADPAADTKVAPGRLDAGGGSGGTVLIPPEDILVTADLEGRWLGWWIVHISSFHESRLAREDVSYLLRHKFPVFIVFLDLGAKGNWYRVYAGPFKTRDEAGEVKKNLDELSRVQFTRVLQITR